MNMKNSKRIPNFRDEEEERIFWEEHDSTAYMDWEKAHAVRFPNLKKSTRTISLRLPEDMLERLKSRANAMDIPYQSYIKMLLQKELAGG
jgi:predicted DNA binding CopG/RHH family protein